MIRKAQQHSLSFICLLLLVSTTACQTSKDGAAHKGQTTGPSVDFVNAFNDWSERAFGRPAFNRPDFFTTVLPLAGDNFYNYDYASENILDQYGKEKIASEDGLIRTSKTIDEHFWVIERLKRSETSHERLMGRSNDALSLVMYKRVVAQAQPSDYAKICNFAQSPNGRGFSVFLEKSNLLAKFGCSAR